MSNPVPADAGYLYVGETDDFHGRTAAHRAKPLWKNAEVYFISVSYYLVSFFLSFSLVKYLVPPPPQGELPTALGAM